MSTAYVTGGYVNAEPYTISSANLSSAAVGDIIIACGPYYGGMTVPSGGAAWNSTSYTWPTFGYTAVLHWKVLNSADLSGNHSLSGVAYGPLTWAVYRGPLSAAVVRTDYNSDSTLPFSVPAKHIRHAGYVHYTTDRDGAGAGSPPSGYTARVGSATGVFTGQIADRLTGSPDDAHTATWTGYGTTYGQWGAVFEFRGADHDGTLASSDDPDDVASAGAAAVSGSIAVGENTGSRTIQGSVAVQGSLSSTIDDDEWTMDGAVLASNFLYAEDEPDSVFIIGVVPVTGLVATSEDNEPLSSAGTVADTYWYGNVDVIEEADNFSASGIAFATGILSSLDDADTVSISGLVRGWGDAGPNDETWTIQDANAETWTRQRLKRKTWTL